MAATFFANAAVISIKLMKYTLTLNPTSVDRQPRSAWQVAWRNPTSESDLILGHFQYWFHSAYTETARQITTSSIKSDPAIRSNMREIRFQDPKDPNNKPYV